MSPEQRLWVHVLTRNLTDSLGYTYPNVSVATWMLIERAKFWIGGKDFNYICELIDLNPEEVIYKYEEIKKTHKTLSQDQTYRTIFRAISIIF
jgi:hypothetical protein